MNVKFRHTEWFFMVLKVEVVCAGVVCLIIHRTLGGHFALFLYKFLALFSLVIAHFEAYSKKILNKGKDVKSQEITSQKEI